MVIGVLGPLEVEQEGRRVTVGGDRLATHGLVVGAGAPPLPATAAAGWLVADMDTGEVLAAVIAGTPPPVDIAPFAPARLAEA